MVTTHFFANCQRGGTENVQSFVTFFTDGFPKCKAILDIMSIETFKRKNLYLTRKFISTTSISDKKEESSSLTNLCLGVRAKVL